MKKTSGWLFAGILTFVAAMFSFSARAADVYVSVSIYGPSPDPVNVQSGDIVHWQDGDEFGPYTITAGSAVFDTPGAVTMDVGPGSYSYSVDSDLGGEWIGTINVSAAVDSPPTVSITSPTNQAQFVAPAAFDFSADASDPDPNDLSDVEFWVGTNLVDDVFSFPYTTTVTNLAPGSYTLTAIAWDYSYATATNSIVITVASPIPISLTAPGLADGKFIFSATNLTAGKTNVLLWSSNLVDWLPIQTNVADSTSVNFTNSPDAAGGFYRLMQVN
ncbi:MAG TPA: Ig-like domain-containing protein [Candidatus Angelobacter sp.]|nr:Ig-like domain-containing protein [Candidatus Angelobacter sp.]